MPTKKQPQKKTVKKTKRISLQLFDGLFKQLLHLSDRSVVSFINGLFGTRHRRDSKVLYLNVETVDEKMRHRLRDTMLEINRVPYHIEVEINKKANMVIRMFEYGLEYGAWKKTYEDGIRTIELPFARIINLQGTEKTPEFETLRLKVPGKPSYDYEVRNFNLLAHSVKELEKMGLAILLPFYVLKLREQVKKAKPGLERKKLSPKLGELLDELVVAVDVCNKKGTIDEKGAHGIIRAMDFLSAELYSQYEEFAEDNSMLKVKYFDTDDDVEERKALKIARNMLADGDSPEKIARNTGLPLAKVKALLKTTKVKQSA
jgi:hypothetical protein